MKAFFEMHPYFKAIINIPDNTGPTYRIAVLEDKNGFETMQPFDSLNARLSPIKILVFKKYDYMSITLQDSFSPYMPCYRFSEIEEK